jgi:hypothetical protein
MHDFLGFNNPLLHIKPLLQATNQNHSIALQHPHEATKKSREE